MSHKHVIRSLKAYFIFMTIIFSLYCLINTVRRVEYETTISYCDWNTIIVYVNKKLYSFENDFQEDRHNVHWEGQKITIILDGWGQFKGIAK